MMIKRLWQRFKAWRQNRRRVYIYLVAEEKPTYEATDGLLIEFTIWDESEGDGKDSRSCLRRIYGDIEYAAKHGCWPDE